MFDLIEENLAAQTSESPAVLPPKPPFIQKDPVVITMPEKFRIAPHNSTPILIAAAVSGGLLVIGGILLGVLILSNQQTPQPLPAAQAQPAIQPPAPVEVQTSTVSSTESVYTEQAASSTPVVVEPVVPSFSSTTDPSADTPVSAVSISPALGADSDNDNLTDAEEELIGTDAKKPDTNENTYLDGNEIIAGYDSASVPGGGHLQDSPKMSEYKNALFSYSLLHPQLWIAKAVNALEREVVIGAANGEFMSVKVEDNPKKLSPREWAAAYAQISLDMMHENRQSQFWDKPAALIAESIDGLHGFIARTDQNGAIASTQLIHLSYQLNLKQEINFASIFRMMVNSVRFGASEKK